LADQVAQKLHACTGPFSAGRARDVFDILLIDSLGRLEYMDAGMAARTVFKQRGTHPFPPNTKIPDEWWPELTALAEELGFPLHTPAEIQSHFTELVERLAKPLR
jgi:hypothetical protein